MSIDKTRIRATARAMRRYGYCEEEIKNFILISMFKKPHVLSEIRKQARVFRVDK